jgi:glycosyltransferase involved in cell wall biosynthesis
MRFLKECLESVLCQLKNRKKVEVIVVDNASSDDTQSIVNRYIKFYDCLKYYRNEKNLGLAGNQIKCIEYATGDYVTLLGDDDIYLDGQVNRILNVVSKREYAIIALNYYNFLKNKNKPYKSNFAPTKDVTFQRAYDVLNYPSVGHSSGFVFNTALAKETLKQILAKRSHEYLEKIFGIVGDVSTRSTTASKLPGFFIGYRGLANRIPEAVNYNSLYNLCLYYYKLYLGFYNEGLINKDDLDYRAKLVIDTLPRAIISSGSCIDDDEIKNITLQLSDWFTGNNKFDNVCMPLLHSLQYKPVKQIYKMTGNLYRYLKPIWYRISA